jgi:broad-specificity NMP kinase
MLMRLKKRGDKMSIINENMTSKEMLGILVEKNMEDARKAKANGELVC